MGWQSGKIYKEQRDNKKMKKIYIAGCGGMLGEAFYKVYGLRNSSVLDKDVNEPWLSFLDFRDVTAYERDVFGFNQIIFFI